MKVEGKTKSFFNGDNILLIIILAFSVMVLIVTNGYPTEAKSFPQLAGGVVIGLCIYELTKRWLRARLEKPSREGQAERSQPPNTLRVENRKASSYGWLLLGGITLAYFIVLPWLGFILSTLATLIVTPLALGYRGVVWIIVLAVASTAVLYWVFAGIFLVPLPVGILGI